MPQMPLPAAIAPALPTAPQRHRIVTASRSLTVGLLSLGLGACAVAPAYRTPNGQLPSAYTSTPVPNHTTKANGRSQELASGATPAHWWKLFKSPRLDALIREAFRRSPTLAASRATLRQYTYLAQAAGAGYYPTVGVDASASRQRTPEQAQTPSTIYNTFAGNLTISYNPDVFGRLRYTQQNAAELAVQRHFEMEAAYETLAGNITSTTIQAAGYQAQINATLHILASRHQALKLVDEQYRLGAATYSDVLTQRSEVASAQASLATLRQELAQTRHKLATLTGHFPSESTGKLPQLGKLTLPAHIPVRLPSTLIQSRPDIRAAEAGLRATYAQYGLAYAQRFPSFAISGTLGRNAPKLSDLSNPVYDLWSIALNASATLFDAGTLKDKSEAAKAAFEAGTANYRVTVLDAFQQVANSLRALNSDADVLKARRTALDSADQALRITRDQYRLGAADFQALLTAQVNASQTRISYLQALEQRYLDTAALYVALGGRAWPAKVSSIHHTTHS